jgi:sucrose phosphorylase
VKGRTLRNQIQLIAYADRLGGTIRGLGQLLDGSLKDLFGGVHVLPFYLPYDGADAGFDPIDHAQVDPRLGGWDDLRLLGAGRDVVADLIVNHVSADSMQFKDVVARGDESPSAQMFLTFGALFPDGATEDDLLAIYRPRPGLPFTPVTLGERRRLVWTTFTPQQIDIDLTSAAGRSYVSEILRTLAAAGVRTVRLDAVGYAVKTPRSSCFMTPETFAFISELTAEAHALGVDVLVEIHSHYLQQIEVGRAVDRVYDFALPPLVLHALFTGDATALHRWLLLRPRNAVTVLDTHDGIGVVDVGPDQTAPDRPGLLAPDQIDALVERIHHNSGGQSRQATGWAASNVDVYQVNCTFYDALGRDDNQYLLARLVQFFVPGIPQVYYVGLLAGVNDMDLLAQTGVGRDINRHHYSQDEVSAALQRPVVGALHSLIRFRNAHPAFDGTFHPGAPVGERGALCLSWTNGEHRATLQVDFAARDYTLSWTEYGDLHVTSDLLGTPPGSV